MWWSSVMQKTTSLSSGFNLQTSQPLYLKHSVFNKTCYKSLQTTGIFLLKFHVWNFRHIKQQNCLKSEYNCWRLLMPYRNSLDIHWNIRLHPSMTKCIYLQVTRNYSTMNELTDEISHPKRQHIIIIIIIITIILLPCHDALWSVLRRNVSV